MQGKLASDLTGDEDIRRILDLKLSKSYIYKDRFSIMVTYTLIFASAFFRFFRAETSQLSSV